MNQFPLLSAILFLPLLGAAGAIVLPRMAGWGWALLVSIADLGLWVWLLVQYTIGFPAMQFVEHQPWLPSLGISYSLGVDGLSIFLVGLSALLTVVAVGASFGFVRTGDRSRQYLAMLLVLSTGMLGVFLATNLFLFYVFWELMLVPAYLLVGMFGGPRRTYAAIKFVLYTAAGSLLMLVGIIALGAVVSTTSHTAYNLDLSALLQAGVTSLPRETQILLFLAFAAAFAVKSGLFPLHSWVPDTYSQAPVPVVVLVAGVMAKTGVYGLLRFCVALFPVAAQSLAPLLGTLAVIGILYFALQALVAQDFMRLLAYVSISHMSVIILGIFALNAQGIDGAIVQMVNHGIVIAALFLIAGAIEARTRSRRLGDFGGLAVRLPWLATVFMIAALAALGLPGLNSFAGEFLAFLGAFQWNVVLGGLGTLVVIPAAWYMLRFFQGIMEGPPREMALAVAGTGAGTDAGAAVSAAGAGARAAADAPSGLVDLRRGELAVLLPLLTLIFYLGFVPNVLTSRIERNIELRLPGAVVFPVSTTGDATPALRPNGRDYILVSPAPSQAQAQAQAAPVGALDRPSATSDRQSS